MRSKILSLILLFLMVAMTACTPQEAATTAIATETQVTVEARTLTVLAAASLTESFTELGQVFEDQNPGVEVALSFAGSQQLAQQLGQGAEADVFASANEKYMLAMEEEANRVNAEDVQTFATNRLVVIFPKDNPAGLITLQDLAKSGIKLDLADTSVPVGQYSDNFLDKATQDSAFDSSFKENVLKNVVSYEDNVKAVLTKVSLGEADAGIVYVTDITPDAADKVDKLDIPDELNTIATYPIAPLADSQNSELADSFIDLVLSPEGQSILAQHGFIPAGDTE